jgi:ribosomal subunit interface protein
MRITKIKATNMEMTDAIRTFVEEKLMALEPKLERFGESVALDVEVGKTTQHHRKGDVFRCEIQSMFPGKKLIRAEKTNDDLYKAIVEAINVFEREVIRYKESF